MSAAAILVPIQGLSRCRRWPQNVGLRRILASWYSKQAQQANLVLSSHRVVTAAPFLACARGQRSISRLYDSISHCDRILACNREVLRICPQKSCTPGQRESTTFASYSRLQQSRPSLNGLSLTSNRDTKGSCRELGDGGEPCMVTSSS